MNRVVDAGGGPSMIPGMAGCIWWQSAAVAAVAAGTAVCAGQDLPMPANDTASGKAPAVVVARSGWDGTPMDPSKPVRVFVESPKPEEVLGGAAVSVRLRADNFLLREGGNRLQAVLDNRRSVLVYDDGQPLVFTNLSEGGHMLRVFAAAGDGRLVRQGETFAALAFHSLRKSADNIPEAGEPVLTVSSPRGTYEGEAAGLVVFDYRVDGVVLSPNGYRVRFLLDGRERFTHEPGPVLFPALSPGTHRLVAEVVDMDDVPVPGIYSRVGTTFEVRPAGMPAVETEMVPLRPANP